MCGYKHRSTMPVEYRKGVRFPEAGVTNGCELPDVCAGTLTQLLCKTIFICGSLFFDWHISFYTCVYLPLCM